MTEHARFEDAAGGKKTPKVIEQEKASAARSRTAAARPQHGIPPRVRRFSFSSTCREACACVDTLADVNGFPFGSSSLAEPHAAHRARYHRSPKDRKTARHPTLDNHP
jgi:hypothetical protein